MIEAIAGAVTGITNVVSGIVRPTSKQPDHINPLFFDIYRDSTTMYVLIGLGVLLLILLIAIVYIVASK